MSTGKILVGVLSGVAVGAALGILFAPDKGSKTRQKLSKSGENLVDGMKGKFDGFLETAKDRLAGVEKEADDMVKKGKSKAKEVKKEVKNAVS